MIEKMKSKICKDLLFSEMKHFTSWSQRWKPHSLPNDCPMITKDKKIIFTLPRIPEVFPVVKNCPLLRWHFRLLSGILYDWRLVYPKYLIKSRWLHDSSMSIRLLSKQRCLLMEMLTSRMSEQMLKMMSLLSSWWISCKIPAGVAHSSSLWTCAKTGMFVLVSRQSSAMFCDSSISSQLDKHCWWQWYQSTGCENVCHHRLCQLSKRESIRQVDNLESVPAIWLTLSLIIQALRRGLILPNNYRTFVENDTICIRGRCSNARLTVSASTMEIE